MSNKKESILILFSARKQETPNTFFFEKKFSLIYNTKILYISDYLRDNNFTISKKINNILKEEKISIVLFQGDGLSIMDINFINSINNNVKKGMLVWDDMMYHDRNRITASACDFVLSGCPLSVFKFQELGYQALWIPVESNGDIFKELNEKKIYDVLFFGRQKNNRQKYIKFLKENNIKILECGPHDDISNTFEKLNKLINQSKIVLNFTEQDNTKYNYNPLSNFKYHYCIKGRVYFTGLSGTLCISEYNPAAELIFKNNELPYFNNEKECLDLIIKYITDNSNLDYATDKYKKKCLEFEDKNYMKIVKVFLQNLSLNRDKPYINIPYWYEYTFFKKNILTRFKQNKFFSFFSQVFISLFTNNYKNKTLLPVVFILTLLSSIIFLFKFPFSRKKYEKN